MMQRFFRGARAGCSPPRFCGVAPSTRFWRWLSLLEWPNLTFIVLTPLIAIAGTWWTLDAHSLNSATLVASLAMALFTGLGITGGYHRLFAHRSYKASLPVKIFYLLFGGASFQGSVLEWCVQHRDHHRHVDSDQDPYSIKKGFWYAHVGWVVTKPGYPVDITKSRDLTADPWIAAQHRFYYPMAAFISFLMPALIASLWNDFWGGFFIAGFARLVINHHLTFCINSVCHTFGRQTYKNINSARDHWFTSLVTYGEGYHNFHHAFEADFRNGYRLYHWDPTKWLILAFEKMGLAWDLYRVKDEKILIAKLAMDAQEIARHLSAHFRWSRVQVTSFVTASQARLKELHERLMELKGEYEKLKTSGKLSLESKMIHIKVEIEKAKAEFKQSMNMWQALLKGSMIPLSL